MLDQIIAAVTTALEEDLPDVEEESWGIVDGRAAQIGTVKRRPAQHDVGIHSFPQSWGSSALGFPGAGGQMMTTAQTVVVTLENTAWVYVGGRFAYAVSDFHANERFMQDLRGQNMAAVMQSFSRYKKT